MGWETFEDESPEELEARRQKALEVAGLYLETFSTDAGQRVLEFLREATIEKPVLDAGSTQFGAGIREGQNNIVRQILEQMRIAREGLDE